jgi:hypothetical protein
VLYDCAVWAVRPDQRLPPSEIFRFLADLKDRNETTRVFNLDISTTEQGSGSLGSAAAGIPS